MITLRQIQFALAVARHQHFKRAAEECNISQSALSLGIAEMEKNLGVAIFERNNKQVVITPIGKELLDRAQKIYLDAQQLMERAHAGQNDMGFGMHIGFIPTIAPFLLPVVLPLIHKSYPNFSLNINEETSDRLINAVQTGRLDAAVLALPYDIASLEEKTFAEEDFFAIMHKSHILSKEEKVTPHQLKNTQLLLLGEGHCMRDQALEVCKMNKDLGKTQFKDASLNTLIQLTVNNMGITLVPEIALPQMYQYDNLHICRLSTPGPHRKLAVVTRPNYPRHQDLEILLDIFSQAVAQLRKQC